MHHFNGNKHSRTAVYGKAWSWVLQWLLCMGFLLQNTIAGVCDTRTQEATFGHPNSTSAHSYVDGSSQNQCMSMSGGSQVIAGNLQTALNVHGHTATFATFTTALISMVATRESNLWQIDPVQGIATNRIRLQCRIIDGSRRRHSKSSWNLVNGNGKDVNGSRSDGCLGGITIRCIQLFNDDFPDTVGHIPHIYSKHMHTHVPHNCTDCEEPFLGNFAAFSRSGSLTAMDSHDVLLIRQPENKHTIKVAPFSSMGQLQMLALTFSKSWKLITSNSFESVYGHVFKCSLFGFPVKNDEVHSFQPPSLQYYVRPFRPFCEAVKGGNLEPENSTTFTTEDGRRGPELRMKLDSRIQCKCMHLTSLFPCMICKLHVHDLGQTTDCRAFDQPDADKRCVDSISGGMNLKNATARASPLSCLKKPDSNVSFDDWLRLSLGCRKASRELHGATFRKLSIAAGMNSLIMNSFVNCMRCIDFMLCPLTTRFNRHSIDCFARSGQYHSDKVQLSRSFVSTDLESSFECFGKITVDDRAKVDNNACGSQPSIFPNSPNQSQCSCASLPSEQSQEYEKKSRVAPEQRKKVEKIPENTRRAGHSGRGDATNTIRQAGPSRRSCEPWQVFYQKTTTGDDGAVRGVSPAATMPAFHVGYYSFPYSCIDSFDCNHSIIGEVSREWENPINPRVGPGQGISGM